MDLNARIARLERRNRLLTILVLVLGVAAPLGVWLPGLKAVDEAGNGGLDVSDRIVLRNEKGAIAASIVATANGANLSLFDGAGKPRMVFTVSKDGSGLVFLDDNQATANKGVRLALSANDKSGPSLSLFGKEAASPLASVRTKGASGSHPATGVFVAVNEENKPVAFPRGAAAADGETASNK